MAQKNPMYSKSLSLFFVVTLLRKDLNSMSKTPRIFPHADSFRSIPLSEKAKSSDHLLRQGKPSAGCGLCILFRRTGTYSSYMDNPQKASDDGYRQHGEPPEKSPPIALDKDQETC